MVSIPTYHTGWVTGNGAKGGVNRMSSARALLPRIRQRHMLNALLVPSDPLPLPNPRIPHWYVLNALHDPSNPVPLSRYNGFSSTQGAIYH